MMLRAVGGILLMVIGQTIATIGRQGLAGSGVVLDPEQAREDVEPWSRMQGGVVKDTLDEVGLDLSKVGTGPSADNELPFDEKLRRLHALHQDGILTDEEYQREKRGLLDSN